MKSVTKPERDGAAEGRTGDWGEVVTRYPYENVGMDHLLSMEKVEKKNLRNLGDSAEKAKRFHIEGLRLTFYLVLREDSLRFCSLKTR